MPPDRNKLFGRPKSRSKCEDNTKMEEENLFLGCDRGQTGERFSDEINLLVHMVQGVSRTGNTKHDQ
jgi:hypothetical protein